MMVEMGESSHYCLSCINFRIICKCFCYVIICEWFQSYSTFGAMSMNVFNENISASFFTNSKEMYMPGPTFMASTMPSNATKATVATLSSATSFDVNSTNLISTSVDGSVNHDSHWNCYCWNATIEVREKWINATRADETLTLTLSGLFYREMKTNCGIFSKSNERLFLNKLHSFESTTKWKNTKTKQICHVYLLNFSALCR